MTHSRWHLVFLTALLAAGLGPRLAADDVDLRAALDDFNAAFVRADAAALGAALTDDYVHTNGGSGTVLNKDRWLEFIRSRADELARGRLRVDEYRVEDLALRRHGDVAIIGSIVVSRGIRDGATFTSRLRVTQVWVLSAGKWRRAAFHDSPLPQQ